MAKNQQPDLSKLRGLVDSLSGPKVEGDPGQPVVIATSDALEALEGLPPGPVEFVPTLPTAPPPEQPADGGAASLAEDVAEEKPPVQFDQAELERAGILLSDYIASIDPAWSERLHIMQNDRGLKPFQAIGALAGYTLDHSLHMAIPSHPAFETVLARPGKMDCPVCHTLYSPQYPGQPVCSNACAKPYYEARKAAA